MNGLFDGLKGDPYDRSYSNAYLAARIYKYFAHKRLIISMSVLLVVLASALMAATPLLIASLIDSITSNNVRSVSLSVGFLIFLTALVAWVLTYIQKIMAVKLVANIIQRLQNEALSAVLDKERAFFDANATGSIASRVALDTEAFGKILVLVLNSLSQFSLMIFLFAVLLYISAKLALLLFCFAPLILLIALAFRHIGRKISRQTQRSTALLNGQLHESLRGISIAKNFGKESDILDTLHKTNQLTYRASTMKGLIYSTIFPILTVISGVGVGLVIYYGANMTLSGQLTIGALYYFVYASSQVWGPIIQVSSFWSLFQSGLASAERVFSLLDDKSSSLQEGHLHGAITKGQIQFENVCFSYDGKRQVLNDFSLRIEAGERVALVGHTGSGKSTIMKLISRAYEYDGGDIVIDGRSLRERKASSYRQCLGIVPQHPFLFSGTVRSNIKYVRPEASDAALKQAIGAIAGGAWFTALPNGLDTLVKENGSNLSVGQRQIIALARVFLTQATIILFDEATASVDPFSEAQIQQGLRNLFQNKTTVIVAHRLSTIRNVDRILVLDAGRVVEQGCYEELRQSGGYFASLYETYYRHQNIDYAHGVS